MSKQQESWLDKWDAEIMWWFYDQIELLFDATVMIDSTEIREKLKEAKKEAISTERQRVLDGVRELVGRLGTYRTARNIETLSKHDLLCALKEMENKTL